MKNAFMLFAVSAIAFTACQKENLNNQQQNNKPATTELTEKMISEDGNNPDENVSATSGENARSFSAGHVYIESNDASANAILVFDQQFNGKLTLASKTWSGGKGAGAGLGSQGALAIDKNNKLLFAVNAGSNTVSSFKIKSNGSVELLHTESSGGTMPISLTVHSNLLYVVNAGSSDISGLKVGTDGKLYPIKGAYQKLSVDNVGPAEIAFTPEGAALLVTEKATNKITAFAVNANGIAFHKVVNSSVGNTPFGFTFARGRYMIVTNADGGNVGTSSCTSYKNINSLYLSAVNGKVANHQSAVCWVATTSFGRFAFIANTGSNTLSSYYVDLFGNIYLIPWFITKAGEKPADIIVSSDNRFVYNINGGSHSLGEYSRGLLGSLTNIGYITFLPNFAAGLVAY